MAVGRGIGIVAVMYGHAIAPWFMSEPTSFSQDAFLQWKWGASFLMPFFFVLSGLSWRDDKSVKATVREALALFLTALFASILFDLFRLGLSWAHLAQPLQQAHLTTFDVLKNTIRAGVLGYSFALSPLWFLAALAFTRVLAALLNRIPVPLSVAAVVFILALSLAAAAFDWRNVLQIKLLGVALISFFAGHRLRPLFDAAVARPWTALWMLIGGAAALTLTYDLNKGCMFDPVAQCGVWWLNDQFGVSMITGSFGNIFWFALNAAAGIVMAIGLSILTARFGGIASGKLALWGRATMNLLIVNAVVLEMTWGPSRAWLEPNIAGDSVAFFLGVLVLTLVLNIWLWKLMDRPIKKLRRRARVIADGAVRIATRPLALPVWPLARNRVSAGND